MRCRFLFALFFIVVTACSKASDNKNPIQKNDYSSEEKDYTISEKIDPQFSNEISEWNEYQAYHDFITNNLLKTNHRQTLENAKTLSDLSKNLKDSILPKKINHSSLNARLNLLYSESLRLADMADIASITETEVVLQTAKVFDAFSSVNAKINAMLEQKQLEALYGDIDIDFNPSKPIEKEKAPPRKSLKRVAKKKSNYKMSDVDKYQIIRKEEKKKKQKTLKPIKNKKQ